MSDQPLSLPTCLHTSRSGQGQHFDNFKKTAKDGGEVESSLERNTRPIQQLLLTRSTVAKPHHHHSKAHKQDHMTWQPQ
eukprot:4884019-Amphidinium_carterae.1